MSKTIQKVVLWVAVIVLVIFTGYSIKHAKKDAALGESNPRMDGTSAPVETTNPQTGGKKMAFSQFVKQGGSYKCEVKQYMSDMENSGTVYVSGENFSGEYTTVAEGRTIDTSFIMRDGYSYTWSSMMPTMGFKVKIPKASANGTATANTSGTYAWNADQIGDYNCQPWTYDSAKFVLPTSITFRDVTTVQ